MKLCAVFFIALSSSYALAGIPHFDVKKLTFIAVSETLIELEPNQPAFFVDTKTNCRFIGETREAPKEGFINKLLGRKGNFIDVGTAVCDSVQVTFEPITIQYELPIKSGQEVKLPLIDTVQKIAPALGAEDKQEI